LADAMLPGQEGSGVRLQKGSDNQYVVGGGHVARRGGGGGHVVRHGRCRKQHPSR
jgi:hypothetical protein